MKQGTEFSREALTISSLPEMFNKSAIQFGKRRCQWYQPNASDPMKTASLNYSDVYMKVKDLSCGLMSLGIQPQDRVTIMAHNCPEWLWSDFAILGSGAVTVTIYPSFSANEMKYIIIIQNPGSFSLVTTKVLIR